MHENLKLNKTALLESSLHRDQLGKSFVFLRMCILQNVAIMVINMKNSWFH